MDKTKKIIISLVVSLVVLLVLNYIVISYTNSDYVDVSVFKEDMLKGRKIEAKDMASIQVKNSKESKQLLKATDVANIVGKVLTQDVEQGEVISEEKFASEEDWLKHEEGYQYISIPISNLSYSTCNKLKKGDIVTVYYTAKIKDVSNAIKDKKRLYSNTAQEGKVTCLLFEAVEVISVHDSTGKETKENVITDILIRLKKEDTILVANLKSQGSFDIVLN